jgi:hypothetical protein
MAAAYGDEELDAVGKIVVAAPESSACPWQSRWLRAVMRSPSWRLIRTALR